VDGVTSPAVPPPFPWCSPSDSLQPGKRSDNPGFDRLKTNGDGGLTVKDRFVHILKFGIEIG